MCRKNVRELCLGFFLICIRLAPYMSLLREMPLVHVVDQERGAAMPTCVEKGTERIA
jgi:hypothetical protein